MLFKLDVLKNFAMFTGKNLYWNLFLIKLWIEIFKNSFFIEHLAVSVKLFNPFQVNMFHFHTSWQNQKSADFLTFSGSIEMEYWCDTDSKRNRFLSLDRSSRPEVFCKKGILRNLAKFTAKHLCLSLFFNKVACLQLY